MRGQSLSFPLFLFFFFGVLPMLVHGEMTSPSSSPLPVHIFPLFFRTTWRTAGPAVHVDGSPTRQCVRCCCLGQLFSLDRATRRMLVAPLGTVTLSSGYHLCNSRSAPSWSRFDLAEMRTVFYCVPQSARDVFYSFVYSDCDRLNLIYCESEFM